jgi:transcriptional regulator with XRE-family HTH domain
MKFDAYLRQLGKNIKAARTRRGMKQMDIHEGSGVTYRHYQNIEAGRVNVTIETLFRLAAILGVRIEELVRDINNR